MIDFNAFEALEEEKPRLLLDTHPDGIHLAMQIQIPDLSTAAVWNNETKRLVWSPEDALSLAWLHEGTQIAALQNPLLSEDFFFSLYSWPQGQLIQQCPLFFPMGYLFDLVVSPANDFAICQWTDQSEFGFEFISINNYSVSYLAKNGYTNRKTNFSTRPLFSPDGHLWASAFQENIDWWVDKNTFESYDKPTRGGKNEIGSLVVFQGLQKIGEIPITVTVPAGYLPKHLKTPYTFEKEYPYISDLRFVDAQNITLRLPSGEISMYNISDF